MLQGHLASMEEMATTRVRHYYETRSRGAERRTIVIIVVAYPCGRHLPHARHLSLRNSPDLFFLDGGW